MAPILTFAMTAAITPGPNNIILSTNAVNYGFKATIPLMLGCLLYTSDAADDP